MAAITTSPNVPEHVFLTHASWIFRNHPVKATGLDLVLDLFDPGPNIPHNADVVITPFGSTSSLAEIRPFLLAIR